jgi:hypothetical protein
MPMTEQGFNNDIVFEGVTYHIQTEDWGESNPFVVTQVFNSGAVVLSLKNTYSQIENTNFAAGRQAIRLGMREQHQKVLDQLVSGTLLSPRIK